MTANPAMDPRTFVPRGVSADSLVRLLDLLTAEQGTEGSGHVAGPAVSLAVNAPQSPGSPGGVESVELPEHLVDAVRLLVGALADGRPVTVCPQEHMVTPHEAADFLHLSRTRLDDLMHTGQLPFRTVGRHHRILLADVLAYHRRVHGDPGGLAEAADD